MKFQIVSVALAIFVLIPFAATADPTVIIYTDADTYQSGDKIEISLSAQNSGQAMSVSVYIGLLTPQGSLYTLSPYGMSGWSSNVEAWIPDIYVPSPFSMDATPLLWLDVPSSMPPIADAGAYNLASVLTLSGTFDWVCNASLAPFSFEGGASSDIPMVSIPAGSFLMGAPAGEAGSYTDERPQRTVNISAFLMSETEITQKQFLDAMGWNWSSFSGDDRPVEQVTWYDSVTCCNALSEAEGLTNCYTISEIEHEYSHIISAEVTCNFDANGYRLPTEAEWEYACRAGTTTRFHSGDSETDLDRAGWYMDNSSSTYSTSEVGQKEPNAWGLYDMHGNVWEWCWDFYSPAYYGAQPDPDYNPTGPDEGPHRIYRGGSWASFADDCRSARRYDIMPHNYCYRQGFRVVRR